VGEPLGRVVEALVADLGPDPGGIDREQHEVGHVAVLGIGDPVDLMIEGAVDEAHLVEGAPARRDAVGALALRGGPVRSSRDVEDRVLTYWLSLSG
jgi:hypothetical protein